MMNVEYRIKIRILPKKPRRGERLVALGERSETQGIEINRKNSAGPGVWLGNENMMPAKRRGILGKNCNQNTFHEDMNGGWGNSRWMDREYRGIIIPKPLPHFWKEFYF